MPLNPYSESPVFAAFLMDASGSMSPYAADVISGHKLMLDTLRGSAKCDAGVLYVYQSLFATAPTVLNAFYPLESQGKDQVVALNSTNYAPDGQTALCASLVAMLKDLDAHLGQVEKAGYNPASRVAVITDGGENMGGNFDEVKRAISLLRKKEWLQSSVVIGLKSRTFDQTKLEQLRDAVGFSQAVGLEQNPAAVRRAFILASKAAL